MIDEPEKKTFIKTFIKLIKDFWYPKGTYSEIPPSDAEIIRKNRDNIKRIQKIIREQMAQQEKMDQQENSQHK